MWTHNVCSQKNAVNVNGARRNSNRNRSKRRQTPDMTTYNALTQYAERPIWYDFLYAPESVSHIGTHIISVLPQPKRKNSNTKMRYLQFGTSDDRFTARTRFTLFFFSRINNRFWSSFVLLSVPHIVMCAERKIKSKVCRFMTILFYFDFVQFLRRVVLATHISFHFIYKMNELTTPSIDLTASEFQL